MRILLRGLLIIPLLASVTILLNELAFRNDLLAEDVRPFCCNSGACNGRACSDPSSIQHGDSCTDETEDCLACMNYQRQDDACGYSIADEYCVTSDEGILYYVCPPLSVSISGPAQLQCYAYGTYTANCAGGTLPLSYEWYQRTDGGGSWVYIGNGSSTQAGGVNGDFYVKVVVTDACKANNGPRVVYVQKYVVCC